VALYDQLILVESPLPSRSLLVQHLLPLISPHKPQERLYIVNSGLVRLENGHHDLYEPGTQRERAYMRGISSIYQTDSMLDASTAAATAVEEDVIDVIDVQYSLFIT
jgi:hypothetical protein